MVRTNSQLECGINRLEINKEVSDDEKYLSHHEIEMIDTKVIKDIIKNLLSFNVSELELIFQQWIT
ncbi:hypothetical protein [Caldicellulosiruptor bescii]|jgi:hypothetical protein|uniref:Uncharacterized protein n=1 Tax=Caldicellulosiruptor bescii (strain ATCC BAA-1888 / DSM 6725 / KCTC 15123 / Z-1320) TaxID=521460 RepID=B9MMS2_CALBD|nr:hypothetical protein [Caldicellulosiruptor bescii]ACM61371.1 hypothetical protein Athe_2301 [Caldicellulosiruptor bescii DSM 6725]